MERTGLGEEDNMGSGAGMRDSACGCIHIDHEHDMYLDGMSPPLRTLRVTYDVTDQQVIKPFN